MEKSFKQSSVLTHAQLLFGAIAITTLTNGFMMVLGFFYGSSQSSARKTEIIGSSATQPQTVNIEKTVRADTVVDSSGGNVDEVITNG